VSSGDPPFLKLIVEKLVHVSDDEHVAVEENDALRFFDSSSVRA
jgi:hypothetical protein